MSDVKYKYLDFTKKVSQIGFGEEFQKMSLPSSASSISFTEEQLKALLADMFVHSLLGLAENSKSNKENIHLVGQHKEPLIRSNKCFAHHLLNSLNANAQSLFDDLQKGKYAFENLFAKPELVDFVELVLIDPTFSYRKLEFGRYNIIFLKEYLFCQREKQKIQRIVTSKKFIVNEYLKSTGKSLDRSLEPTHPYEKYLMSVALFYMVQPKELTIDMCLKVGGIIQRNIFTLNARLPLLKSICKNAIRNQNVKYSNKKGRKP